MISALKLELLNYGESTSIRGIPKFVKSKDPFLKFLWLVFVIACALVLATLLGIALNRFMTWPVMTKYSEKVDGSIKFPDITICNLDTFATGYSKVLPVKYYFDFLKENKEAILDLLRKYLNTNASGDRAELIFEELNSIPGYILNLPKNYESYSDCPGFILQCNAFSSNLFNVQIDCAKNFTKRWNENYYTCYTLHTSKLQPNRENTPITGLSLVLNVGPPNLIQIPYKYSFASSQARGVQVSVHSPETPPDLKRGFSVAPGTENIVTLVQTERERLDKPYNVLGCTNQMRSSISPDERYTRDSCADYCKQALIYKQCGCMSNYLRVPPNYADTVNICGNFSLYTVEFNQFQPNVSRPEDRAAANFFCSLLYLENDCESRCQSPCKETLYDSYLSTASWPQYSLQLGIFDRYIYKMNCTETHPSVRQRYANYLHLYDIYSSLNVTQLDVLVYNTSKLALTQIQESLLTIKFIIKEIVPFYAQDSPAYTWDTVVGVVGGMLSLWLGISAATVVELIELLYQLFKCCFKNRRHLKSKNDNKVATVNRTVKEIYVNQNFNETKF